MKISRAIVALSVVWGGLAAGPSLALAASASSYDPIQDAVPLTTDELYQLYSNRSWIWSDGAGYFAAKQRRFVAWSGAGASASYGVGQWFLADGGKLCFRAEWRAADGAAPTLSCFSHRKSGGMMFQKREPNGEWHVFAHTPFRPGDEVLKLRHGDYVGARLKEVEASLAARR